MYLSFKNFSLVILRGKLVFKIQVDWEFPSTMFLQSWETANSVSPFLDLPFLFIPFPILITS